MFVPSMAGESLDEEALVCPYFPDSIDALLSFR